MAPKTTKKSKESSSVHQYICVSMAISLKARKKERIAERNAITLYSQKKNDKFVVSHQRTTPELRCKLDSEIQPWPDLPPEILASEVVSRLSSFDRIRFRAVCKNWERLLPRPPHEDDNVKKLPWLLDCHWNDDGFLLDDPMVLVCELFDPSHHKQPYYHKKPYSVDQVIGQDIRSHNVPKIRASHHGWLLFSWQKHPAMESITSYFLFSPFTKQIITLPDLNHDIRSCCRAHIAAFSSDPCSPDCVFFVVRDYYCCTITISTCCPRDMSWTTQAFEGQPYCLQGVVFVRRFLCCLFDGHGALAAFNVAKRKWILVTTNSNLRLLPGSYHLFECKGQLFFANLYVDPILSDDYRGQCRLFRLSHSRRAWVTETSCLGNQALFLGRTSSFCISASGETTNKVYYHAIDGSLRFYSMEDGTNHALEGSPHAGWVAAKGWNERIWIQPPQLRTNLEFEG
ncbi:uncharacterized protein LOC131322884 [Rhododendron vialii]|uniref:uncharacterized protein LOC131322884 n=1 Tax=Rhododendron vialii TaxID=182163 RepID=UPI00265E142D|nr:uncharacterized protein LOC131322884 [Rhododendron vialii]